MNLKKTLLLIVVLWVMALVPVVPVLRAAVIPDPIYRLTWISVARLLRYFLLPAPGLMYNFPWYSVVALMLWGGAATVAGRFVKRRLDSR